MEIVDGKALKLKLRNPNKVLAVIPKSALLDEGQVSTVMVHWGLEEAQVLKNLRIKNVPSPIIARYKWPGLYAPFAHQKQTAAFLTLHRKAFCFSEPGTGKTLSVTWAADYLLTTKHIKRVLIICPLSIMQSAWQADIFKGAMHRRVGVAYGSKEKRLKVINSDAEFVIINFDGVGIVEKEIEAAGFDLIVVDEANAYKSATTTRWKTLHRLVKPNTWLWMLTGTPASQSPLDAYGLAKLVNPSAAPRSFTLFRDQVMNKITQFKWSPKVDAQQKVSELLQPAIRFTKEQCLDLPDLLYTIREVPMTPQQERYYDKLRKQMAVQAAGEEVTAVNAAAKLNKLLQISCISYNTPVLTQLGWIPICNVTSDDYVWDGDDWVRCKGAVFKGMRKTMVLDGVSLTPEHLVWTSDGWKPAEECANGYASKRFDRAKVRLPDGIVESRNIKWENEESNMALPMRLRGRSDTGIPESTIFSSAKPKALWMPSWHPAENSRFIDDTTIRHMGQDAPKVPEPKRQGFQKLWGAWHNRMQTMGRFVRELLGRHAGGLCGTPNARPKECEQGLQQSKLPVGNSARTGQQHAIQSHAGYAKWLYDCDAGRTDLRVKEGNLTCTADTLRLDATRSINEEGEIAVFDLVNCGPRNRFVVRGNNGEHLIVHNCGAVYSDSGDVVSFDSSSRTAVLKEVIDESSHKVLVFVPFRHAIDILHEKLIADGYSTEVIHGGVSAGKRAEIFQRFQEQDDIRVLVIQPQAASHGVTLHAANTVVWWAPITSYETYAQANARVHRAGQKNKCLVVKLQGSPVEAKLYRALDNKEEAQIDLMKLYKEELGDNKDQP